MAPNPSPEIAVHRCLASAAALLLACTVATPARAACDAGTKTVFSCHAKSGKRIQVCDSGATIDYSFGRPDRPPEILVRAPRRSASTFQWQGVGRDMTYAVDVPNGRTKYSVYWSVDRATEEHAIEAGVLVEQDGTELARVQCVNDKALVQNIEGIDLKPSE